MKVFALLLASLCCISSDAHGVSIEGIRAITKQGIVVGAAADGIRIFKGIPYAAPPVGALRWRPPQKPAKWERLRSATEFGPPCPSVDTAKIQQGRRLMVAGGDILIGVPAAAGSSEDCLYLNIWAPATAKRAAVMVWIQPIGASSLSVFDGTPFARAGVVMVTMDYRQLTLGNFVHPSLTKEAQPSEPLGRFQTMDQMAALRWVKQNIAAFGGDPSNVTVFGESAGAASTLQLLTIPEAHGLIDKAIVQSGVGWWSPLSLGQMERMGSWLATQAGLPGKDATAEQLRALDTDALPQVGVYSIDGRLQPENGTTAMAAGRMADVPLLIGWTDFDGSSLRGTSADAIAEQAPADVKVAYSADNKTGADLGYQLYTDSHVGAPARWIATKASKGAPSYLYLFSYVRTAKRGAVRGAAHGDDMFFLFDAWDKVDPRTQLSEEDRQAAHMVRSCWVSFANTGKPQCDGAPDWPHYTRQDDQLMNLGVKAEVRREFRKRQLDVHEAVMQDGLDKAEQSVEDSIRKLEDEGAHLPSSIGATQSPEDLRGTWALQVEGRNLFVLKLETGSHGLSGTLQRPTSVVLTPSNAGMAFSRVQAPIYTSQISQQRSTPGGIVFSYMPPNGIANEFLLRSEGNGAARFAFDASNPDGLSVVLMRAGDSTVVVPDWEEGKTYFVRAPAQSPNAELAAIFAADQADRRAIDWSLVGPRGEARRKRVREMLDEGLLRAADDYYCAAFVFQHGSKPEDYLVGHALAMAAVALGRADASWISSATLDRFLQSVDRPQIFGTQFLMKGGVFLPSQGKYDSTLIPDSLRGVLGVPTRGQQEVQRKQMESRK